MLLCEYKVKQKGSANKGKREFGDLAQKRQQFIAANDKKIMELGKEEYQLDLNIPNLQFLVHTNC